MSDHPHQVEISAELLAEAERMEINAAEVVGRALAREIEAKRNQLHNEDAARQWQEENAEGIAWSNRRFEERGFPFPQYRRY
jgi:antitoxin CcdA